MHERGQANVAIARDSVQLICTRVKFLLKYIVTIAEHQLVDLPSSLVIFVGGIYAAALTIN